MALQRAAHRGRGYGLVLLAAVLWGLLGVFSKLALAEGLGPLEIAFWRALLGGGAFLVHARLSGRLKLQRASDIPAFAAFALVGVTLFYAALNIAIDKGGMSLAVILLYSAPAFVALLAFVLLKESLTPLKIVLVVLATVGVALVARSGGTGIHATGAAVTWGLTAGLSYATYYVFGKWILRRYHPVTIYAFVMPLGALGLLPFVRLHAMSIQLWGTLGLMALLSTYLAYLAYYSGLRHVEASRAVLVATVEPVVATALAALLFGERLGGWGFVGGGLVLMAAFLSALPQVDRTGLRARSTVAATREGTE